MAKITKNYYIPFLDVGDTPGEHTWGQIGRSTIFELNFNPTTEERDYIMYASPQEELESYRITMDQEIETNRGDTIYDFLENIAFNIPLEDVSRTIIPTLVVWPKLTEAATTMPAWLYDEAQVVINTLNSVDGVITFTINFNGDPQLGTVTVTDGAPVFTATPAAGGGGA